MDESRPNPIDSYTDRVMNMETMPSEANKDKVIEALKKAYEEHDRIAEKRLMHFKALSMSSGTSIGKITQAEEEFHFHNCMAAVLYDILRAGEFEPQTDEPF